MGVAESEKVRETRRKSEKGEGLRKASCERTRRIEGELPLWNAARRFVMIT